MKVSLIITTYNRPDALKLVIKSALEQTKVPDEIVVADDGSGDETKRVIDEAAAKSSIPILHAWQEDRGFRAAMSRNRSIALSSGDYIVMIDGDMLLHPSFILDHSKEAHKGCFVQGSRVLLSKEATEHALREQNFELNIFSKGLKNRKNAIHSTILKTLFSKKSDSLKGVRTCNFALFRSDILQINGFDNRFVGWGREDSEFAARLLNSGIVRKDLKFSAIAYHLYHPESNRSSLPENDARLAETIERKIVRCEDGIDRFLKEQR